RGPPGRIANGGLRPSRVPGSASPGGIKTDWECRAPELDWRLDPSGALPPCGIGGRQRSCGSAGAGGGYVLAPWRLELLARYQPPPATGKGCRPARHRWTRAEPPLANASTSLSRAIVTSPWYVVSSAPC